MIDKAGAGGPVQSRARESPAFVMAASAASAISIHSSFVIVLHKSCLADIVLTVAPPAPHHFAPNLSALNIRSHLHPPDSLKKKLTRHPSLSAFYIYTGLG